MNNKHKGFTLIEILIALAIMSILTLVAYPAYQEQVNKSRRVDAQSGLLALSNALERYHINNNTFVGAAVGAGGLYPAETPIDGANKYYDLSIPVATATTYTIRAIPKNAQVDDGCLQIASIGTRTRFAADDCSGATSNW